MANGNKTFWRITNKDIWEKLEGIEKKLEQSCANAKQAKWVAGIALSLIFLLAGWFFTHLNK